MYNTTYSFYGASGSLYNYYLPQHVSTGTIPAVAGNYIFATLSNNVWHTLYVGESENLQNRLVINHHEKMDECERYAHPNGFSILYHGNGLGQEGRLFEEDDLRRSLHPHFNRYFNR